MIILTSIIDKLLYFFAYAEYINMTQLTQWRKRPKWGQWVGAEWYHDCLIYFWGHFIISNTQLTLEKKTKLILWKVLEIVLFRYIRFELVITHALWNLFWVYVGIVFLQDQVKIYGLMANIKETQKLTVLKYFHGNEKDRILFDVTQCNCIQPKGKK